MKETLIRAAAAGLGAYFRHVPLPWGKWGLWRGVARPYITWRPIVVEARTAEGLVFAGPLSDHIQQCLYFFGQWEPALSDYMAEALSAGDIVVDVGANVGAHALRAARLVGPGGRVHAVEASPTILAMLARNVARNGAGNVVLHHAAALDRAGEVAVFLHGPSNLAGSTVVADVAAERAAVQEATVPGRPLGEIVPLEDLLAARLVKIDVEGAEALVLTGIRHLLPRFGPRTEFLVEINAASLAAAGLSVREILAWFAEAGFEPWLVPNSYDIRAYIAPRPAAIAPLRSPDFDQCDILFRRPAEGASPPG